MKQTMALLVVLFCVLISQAQPLPVLSSPIILSDTNFSVSPVFFHQMAVIGDTVHVVFVMEDTLLQYRRSLDGGRTFEPVMDLSDSFSVGGYSKIIANKEHVFVFVTKDGYIYFRRSDDFGENFNGWKVAYDLGSGQGIFLMNLAIANDTLAAIVQNSEGEGIFVSPNLGETWNYLGPKTGSSYGALAVTPGGKVHMVFTGYPPLNGNTEEIYYKNYANGGWSESIILSNLDNRPGLNPFITGVGNNLMVTWQQSDGLGNYSPSVRISPDAGVSWLLENGPYDCNGMAIYWFYAGNTNNIHAVSLIQDEVADVVSYTFNSLDWRKFSAMNGVGSSSGYEFHYGIQLGVSDNSIHMMKPAKVSSGKLALFYQRADFHVSRAQLNVSKKELNYNVVGEIDTLVLENISSDTIYYPGAIRINNSNFVIIGGPYAERVSLLPGMTKNVLVKFQPTGNPGGVSGSLYIYYNGDDSPIRVNLVSRIVALVSPQNGRRLVEPTPPYPYSYLKFMWNAVEGATAYQIKITIIPSQIDYISTSDTVTYYDGIVSGTDTSCVPSSQYPSGLWHTWKVRVIFGADTGLWSEEWKFKTKVSGVRYQNIFTAPGWTSFSFPFYPIKLYTDGFDSDSSVFLKPFFMYTMGYQTTDTLYPRKGYWIKTKKSFFGWYGGYQPKMLDTFFVKTGWNFIGSLVDSVTLGNIKSIPTDMQLSDFYVFIDGEYVKSDTIAPGCAYWVHASSEGAIIMALSDGSEPQQKTIHVVPINELPPLPPGDFVDEEKIIPKEFSLSQNHPNPFNPTTMINYELPEARHVTLEVYNMLGQKVTTLVDGMEDAGYKMITFDGSKFPSGIYFYHMSIGEDYLLVRKMILLK
ncbi:MAG: T9SS type A sorting domain-containing protein [Candidatus Paceibacterota bacterium]